MNFLIGDVVMLKSGGPKMTVLEPSNPVKVAFFHPTEPFLGREEFPPEALEKVEGQNQPTEPTEETPNA